MKYRVRQVEQAFVETKNGAEEGYDVFLIPVIESAQSRSIKAFVFKTKQTMYEPQLGDIVEPFYNDWGRIDCLLPDMPI